MPAITLFRRRLGACAFACITLISNLGAATTPLPAALPDDLLPELKTLIHTALDQSPNLVAYNVAVVQAEAGVYLNASALWPNVFAYGSYGTTETGLSNSPTSKTTGPQYSLSFSQPVFYWGTLKAQADIATLQRDIAERNYAEAYRNLAQTIRSQYLALVQKKIAIRNIRWTQHLTESNVSLLQKKLDDGRISPGDLNIPRLELDEANAAVDKAIFEFDFARSALARIAGVPSISADSIPDSLPKPVFAPETLSAFFEDEKRIDFGNTNMGRLYADSIRQAELSYKEAKYRLFPKFGVNASTGQQNNNTVSNGLARTVGIKTTSFSGTATWTLFDGFATKGAKLSSLAAKRQAQQNLKDYTETSSARISQLEKLISLSGRGMGFAERRLDLALSAVQRVKEDAAQGVTSETMIDSFTDGAYKAEAVAVNARVEFLTLWADYLSTVGLDPAVANVAQKDLRHVH